jgi:hypothetical protein
MGFRRMKPKAEFGLRHFVRAGELFLSLLF